VLEFEAYVDGDEDVQETDADIEYRDYSGEESLLAFLVSTSGMILIPNATKIQEEDGTVQPWEALQNISKLVAKGHIKIESKTVQLITITAAGKNAIRDLIE
jgi:hypothetical protein